MIGFLSVSFFVYLLTSPSFGANDWSQFPYTDIYPVLDKSNCAFPFTYRGQQYTDCTNDGDNGNIPWCSLTNEYQGLFTYCYDFRNTNLTCLPTYTVNGRTFTGCAFLSRSARYKQCRTNHPTIRFRYCTEEHTQRSGRPLMRLDTCDSKYRSLSSAHTMCFGPSDYAIQVPLNQTEKDALLAKHNEFRAAVSSEYMFKLYWDDELAKMAQAHSDMCAFDHDVSGNRLTPVFNWKNGQNMVMSTELATPLEYLLEMMLGSERDRFSHGVGCTQGEGSCLHYTQAMLSNMTRVGCAQTHCVFPHGIERYLTCNYIHSQYQDNYRTPYVPNSVSASKCPNRKDGNLCDCGNKICNYNADEYLVPDTCECKSSVAKRSLNKRDTDDGDLENRANAFIAVPGSGSVDATRSKRSFRVISQDGVGKHRYGHKQNTRNDDSQQQSEGIAKS